MTPITDDSSSSSSRPRVLRLISLLPGIHVRELGRLLGISFSSTRYHVDKLCVAGEVVRQTEKGHVRLYPAGVEARDKIVYSFLRMKRSRDILIALAKDSKLTNKEICYGTGLSKSTVSKCIHDLVSVDLVKIQVSKTEGTITYEISDPKYLLQLLMDLHHSTDSRNGRSWPGSSMEGIT